MINLNQEYTTQQLALELNIAYNTLRNYREAYENYLQTFYDYKKFINPKDGRSIIYIFYHQKQPFLLYREYKKQETKRKNLENPKKYCKRKTERIRPISVSAGQNKIRNLLYWNNVPFKQEYTITINNKIHQFDFALFNEKGIFCFIEFDGEQHFISIEEFGGEKGLLERQKLDKIKDDWCRENNYKLIRISYKEIDTLTFRDINNFIYGIKSHKQK